MDNTPKIGLIAEEINELFPELVNYDEDDITPRGVNYPQITALLIKELQFIRNRLKVLESI